MDATSYHDIRSSLRQLYLDDPRPWLVGFSGGKDSTMLASLILQKPNPWGGDNRPLYKVYANASNGECPIQIDTSTPSCGNSRFGCWTCTVVDRDKASEGLLAAGDERMEHLIQFRDTLLQFREPANGYECRVHPPTTTSMKPQSPTQRTPYSPAPPYSTPTRVRAHNPSTKTLCNPSLQTPRGK
jgi:3'-phosphoadenosine 5'-phosphosulfate sulfotransferase (PAPS reductase)/FAD synthetase